MRPTTSLLALRIRPLTAFQMSNLVSPLIISLQGTKWPPALNSNFRIIFSPRVCFLLLDKSNLSRPVSTRSTINNVAFQTEKSVFYIIAELYDLTLYLYMFIIYLFIIIIFYCWDSLVKRLFNETFSFALCKEVIVATNRWEPPYQFI